VIPLTGVLYSPTAIGSGTANLIEGVEDEDSFDSGVDNDEINSFEDERTFDDDKLVPENSGADL
jgi:hypothetical protein